jgi:putative phosphoesterase
MLMGIFGDSHDHMENIEKAVEKFNRERIDLAIHTGDYISPFVIPAIAKLASPIIGVYGNNDGDQAALHARCSEFPEVRINGYYTQIAHDGLKIALIHGHDAALLQDLIVSGYYDLVVHGHTHRADLYRKGRTLVLNPGELCGYLTSKATVAFFDTLSREAWVEELENTEKNTYR